MTAPDPDRTSRLLAEIAIEAGRFLHGIVDRSAGLRRKPDGTNATDADHRSEQLIVDRLAAALPDIPVVAEESCIGHEGNELFLLVDPLDGTSDFLHGGHDYSVNIALVQGTRPIAAALVAPGRSRLWAAGRSAVAADMPAEGASPTWTHTTTRPRPAAGPVALGSRRHGDPETDRCLAALSVAETVAVSSALKFGLIASGEADIYVRCGPTMEWDTAAGDHIVTCAGGAVFGPDRAPLAYGHPERAYRNGPFAAVGDRSLQDALELPSEACLETRN